jgi:16S rRNA (guanine527-N7)-methyltransferase
VKRPPVHAVLAALCERHALGDSSRAALRALLDRLADPSAPTTVHEPRRALDVHVADSLVALDLPAVRSAARIADLGSGAGLPALVLAAALPDAAVTAVESAGRKATFIAETAEAMGLANVAVAAVRAEEWKDGVGACDVVCARALASLAVVEEYAAPLLRVGGTLVAWKGAVETAEARDAAAAAEALGLVGSPPVPVVPYRGSERRSLHLYSKVAETPPRYPRRAGMAVKRPLRADA